MASIRSYISTHRQAIMNTIGMSFVFSAAMQNMRVKSALDEELGIRKANDEELKKFRSLLEETWMKEAEIKVRKGQSTLKQELHRRLDLKEASAKEVVVKDIGRII